MKSNDITESIEQMNAEEQYFSLSQDEGEIIYPENASCVLGEQIFITEAADATEGYLRKLFSIPETTVIDKSKHIEEYFDVTLPEGVLSYKENSALNSDGLMAAAGIAMTAAANTSRITILNKTMTSVTFSYNFAATDKNRYMYFYDSHTNDWDWNISVWNDRGVPVNPPVSGTVTVNNLMPEGKYKIRMSYNNTGTWVYDYYEFTMPEDISGLKIVDGDKMQMTIPTYLYNMLGASEANRYIYALETSYNHLEYLVGSAPYSGAKINIVSNKHEGSYIACSGNPIKFREAYLIEDFLYFKRPIGLSVYSNHELSHDFDSSRWNFDAEFFACFKSAYVYDMTKYSFIDHEKYYANGDMTSFFKSDQLYGGHDGMISTGVYHHYGLCYNMMKIKEVIGWEPFRQTFRFFNKLASNSIPMTNLTKLNLFLTKLRDFSQNKTDVIAMFTAQEKSIYQTKFGGTLAYDPIIVHTDDHPDDIWNGTWLDINMPMEGTINFAGDIDCFRFKPTATGKYLIMSGGDTPLTLQQAYQSLPSGSAQGIYPLFTDNESNFKMVYKFTKDTIYYFKVAHTSATAVLGDYTITVKYDDGSVDDHSNTIWNEDPTPLTLDIPMSGKINYASDIDCFSFKPTATGRYIIMSSGGTPLKLQQLYELLPSGSIEGKSALFTDSSSSFKRVYEFEKDKTYVFSVAHTSATAVSGNYTIIVKLDDGSVDDHSNEILNGAPTPLALGIPTNGKINYTGDVDCFQFKAPTTSKYIVMSGGSIPLTLQQAYEMPTTTSSKIVSPLFTDAASNFKIVYTLTQGTIYAFKVTSGVLGDYTITVKLDDGSVDDHSNEILNGAPTPLTLGIPMNGKINYAGDIDCFSFKPTATGRYIIMSGGNIALTLQQAYEMPTITSSKIVSPLFTDSASNFKMVYTFTKGTTYAFKVTSGALGNYTVKVMEDDGSVDDHSNEIWYGAPTPLTLGIPMNGKINYAGDIDCFQFKPEKTGRYIIMSGGNTPLTLQQAYIMPTTTSSTTLSPLFTDAASNFKRVYTLTQETTYAFKVTSDVLGNYTVKVMEDDGSVDDHSNEIWKGAPTPLTEDVPVAGKINYAGDIDCFSFIPTTTGRYTIFSNLNTPLTISAAYELLTATSAQGISATATDSSKQFARTYQLTAGKEYVFMVKHTSATASSVDYLIMIICGELDDTDEIYIVPEDETEYIPDAPLPLAGGGNSGSILMNGRTVMTTVMNGGRLYGSLNDLMLAISGTFYRSSNIAVETTANGKKTKVKSMSFHALSVTKKAKLTGSRYFEYIYNDGSKEMILETDSKIGGSLILPEDGNKISRSGTKWKDSNGQYCDFLVNVQIFYNLTKSLGITLNAAIPTVTFNTDGVSTPAPQTAFTVSLPSVSKPGYTFDGWYSAATGGTKVGVVGDYYTPAANITLYARWTLSISGREVVIPETVEGALNGVPKILKPRDNWGGAGGGSYGSGVQKENGRYKVAVGPKIINPDYPDTGKIQWDADGLERSKNIDVVLKHKTTGETKIIECVATDVKAHSYKKYPDGHGYNTGDIASFNVDNGLIQTGIAYPNSSNAKQPLACSPAHMGSIHVIEFCGQEVDFTVNDYELVKLFVK